MTLPAHVIGYVVVGGVTVLELQGKVVTQPSFSLHFSKVF